MTFRLYTYMKCYLFSALMMLFALAFASTPVMLSTFIICSVLFSSAGLIIKGIGEFMFIDDDFNEDSDIDKE